MEGEDPVDHNIQKSKESLVNDYEEKLQNNFLKLHREQEKVKHQN
jgi:hypothetical protein